MEDEQLKQDKEATQKDTKKVRKIKTGNRAGKEEIVISCQFVNAPCLMATEEDGYPEAEKCKACAIMRCAMSLGNIAITLGEPGQKIQRVVPGIKLR